LTNFGVQLVGTISLLKLDMIFPHTCAHHYHRWEKQQHSQPYSSRFFNSVHCFGLKSNLNNIKHYLYFTV